MRGKYVLYLDQYGKPVWAKSVRDLRAKAGGGRVSKQYVDKKDGSVKHTGYVIGARWFSAFQPIELPA